MKTLNKLSCAASIYALLCGSAIAAGETGEVTISSVKVADGYTEIYFTSVANNPDSCSDASRAVVLPSHNAKKDIYSAATAAMNSGLMAVVEVDGCSTVGEKPSRPNIRSFTIRARQ